MTQRVTRVSATTGPELAVTLNQMKAHLGITHDSQDELLRVQLVAAHEWAEEMCNRAISSRQYLTTRDKFPVGAWKLPRGRISAINSVQYVDSDGAVQTWADSPLEYESDLTTDFQPRLMPKPGFAWPSTGNYLAAARVTFTAGWSAADVPYTIRQAILLKCGVNFGTRIPGDDDPEAIENAARILLVPWTLPPF